VNAMAEQESTVQVSRPTLASLVKSIESLEVIVEGWNDSQRLTVQALRKAIEDLHKEALSRLIRGIKAHPAAMPALRQVVGDEVVYAVLRHLELVKPSLNERIEQALASVRPLLQGHGGNVELVRVDPPDSVEIKLVGACDGCPSSGLTLSEGIEKAIREQCPEIVTINKVKSISPSSNVNGATVFFVSPFAKNSDAGWQFAVELAEIPETGIKVLELAGHSLLFSRADQVVTCFENACAHMGMPLDMGVVADGVITCPYHGFRYDLSSGECLTAPEVQLVSHAVRVVGSKVEVKLRR
jgi:Fe-S cluster biogenesis protein NfuA/nitrite reductase/ring-hydroxylating ferredoxin subunit